MAAERIRDVGLAMFCPAISGAEPCCALVQQRSVLAEGMIVADLALAIGKITQSACVRICREVFKLVTQRRTSLNVASRKEAFGGFTKNGLLGFFHGRLKQPILGC